MSVGILTVCKRPALQARTLVLVCVCGYIAVDARVKGKESTRYLLSDHIWIMACLNFE